MCSSHSPKLNRTQRPWTCSVPRAGRWRLCGRFDSHSWLDTAQPKPIKRTALWFLLFSQCMHDYRWNIIKYSYSCVNIHLVHVNRLGSTRQSEMKATGMRLQAHEICTNNTLAFGFFFKKRRRDLKCTGKTHLCNHCQFVTPDQFVNVGCAGLRPRVPSGLLAPGHLGKAAEQRRFRIEWMVQWNIRNLVVHIYLFNIKWYQEETKLFLNLTFLWFNLWK